MRPISILKVIIAGYWIVLAGCGNNLFQEPEKDYLSPPLHSTFGYRGIEAELQKASFYCPADQSCPRNVGMILFRASTSVMGHDVWGESVGQCTGFLVAEDIVATNSHCVPVPYKKKSVKSCEELGIRFLEEEGKKSIFTCESMLGHSEFNPVLAFSYQDYAFFKIAKTGRSYFEIHRGDFVDNQPISLLKVTPTWPGVVSGGRLESSVCNLTLNTVINRNPQLSQWSLTGVSVGCPVINGNSGSPVLNQEGKVIGIAQSGWDLQGNVAVSTRISHSFASLFPTNDRVMGFTNLSCVLDPISQAVDTEKCQGQRSLQVGGCEDKNIELFSQQQYQNFIQKLSSQFLYKVELKHLLRAEDFVYRKAMEFEAFPLCVKPDASLRAEGSLDVEYLGALRLELFEFIDPNYRLVLGAMPMVIPTESVYKASVMRIGSKWSGFVVGKNHLLYMDTCSAEQLQKGHVGKVKFVNDLEMDYQNYRVELQKTCGMALD